MIFIEHLMKNYKLLLLLLLGSVAAGCGQPGPLYLPDQPPPIHVEPEEDQ
jgi:predicted small lipoprotein YifL